ncbi:hypothetical protein AZH51_04060 [Branchiibius sp. NY16-3462-2]|nr:hypothetical protein AZH51_04060 [Branchiibius sp. NY16-3462-2]
MGQLPVGFVIEGGEQAVTGQLPQRDQTGGEPFLEAGLIAQFRTDQTAADQHQFGVEELDLDDRIGEVGENLDRPLHRAAAVSADHRAEVADHRPTVRRMRKVDPLEVHRSCAHVLAPGSLVYDRCSGV